MFGSILKKKEKKSIYLKIGKSFFPYKCPNNVYNYKINFGDQIANKPS